MNLNENIQRIKQVMGLNEEVVDYKTYDSNEDMIKEMSVMEVLPNGNVLIKMLISTFIPTQKLEGLKQTLRVITEWDKSMRLVDMTNASITDADTDNKDIIMSWHIIMFKLKNEIFKKGNSVKEVMHKIYGPYYEREWHRTKKPSQDVVRALESNIAKLDGLLQSSLDRATEPEAEPILEPKDKSIWASE